MTVVLCNFAVVFLIWLLRQARWNHVGARVLGLDFDAMNSGYILCFCATCRMAFCSF